MKYAGEEQGRTNFHIDYGNNTLGPLIESDDFTNRSATQTSFVN